MTQRKVVMIWRLSVLGAEFLGPAANGCDAGVGSEDPCSLAIGFSHQAQQDVLGVMADSRTGAGGSGPRRFRTMVQVVTDAGILARTRLTEADRG